MSFNRIAVYGHRGLFNSKIVSVLIASGAPITVLYRPGSDTTNLPPSVPKIEVDVLDEKALIAALQNIDIVLSLVGDEGIDRELGFVQAIPHTQVKLFVPSDLGLLYAQEAMALPVLRKKECVLEAAKQAGIPLTRILIANFAEFTLGSIVMGIDVAGNRLLYTSNAAKEKASMCTANYVAAAYVSIFTTNPVSDISNRNIGLIELAPTGEEIAAALEKRHSKKPQIFTQSNEQVMSDFQAQLHSDLPAIAAAWYWRKLWGTGELTTLLGPDIWDVAEYRKATLNDLVVDGKVGSYRDLSPIVPILEKAMFE